MIAGVTSADPAALLADAKPYRPIAVVTARRLTEPLTWLSERGDPLRGAAGDWQLTDADGNQWTIAPATFARSYRRRPDGTYAKHEVVEAVRLAGPALIPTREGPSAANAGDWLLRDATGAVWPITDRLFQARYRPV
jgi:hypothetical protein